MEEVPKKIRKNVDHKAKRAMRRKRNMIARSMKLNKAQHEKRIEPKKRQKRDKISVDEALAEVAEDYEDRTRNNTSEPGTEDRDQRFD